MKDAYDVAVIGAGIGGLTAGALLAKKGYSVAVFEEQNQPGGYCTSFRRKGYTFDSCLDAISGCGDKGWLRKILRQLEVEDKVQLVRLDPLRVDVFGGESVVVPGEFYKFKEELFGLAPRERPGIEGLLLTMEEIYRTAMVTPPHMLYNDKRISSKEGPLSRYGRASYKALLDDYVRDEKVRAVMSDRCAFMGLPPSKVSATAMTTMFMTFALGGGYRIKGGAQKLTDALAEGLLKAGGELCLRNKAARISISKGRVSGIEAGGEVIKAKTVVSAIDAGNTYSMAGLESTGKMKPSSSFFMVYLGLKGVHDIPDSTGFYPGFDIEGTFSNIGNDIASENASLEIINYSRISPEMAPAGCTALMLMAKASFQYGEGWYNCKRKEAERLIEKASRVYPGIKDNMGYAEAATPLTLERFTGNSRGAAFGYEQDIENRRANPDAPLEGLFLSGHWTYPGGGIESVAASGIVAAEKAASYLN